MLNKKLFRPIYNLLRKRRYQHIKEFLSGESILEVGSSDNLLRKIAKNKNVLCTDIAPKEGVIKQDVEKLKLKDKSFDTVLCMEVLEHTKNPGKAINELRRVTKKRLIISVPYEPWFTLWRFLIWETEHLWSIRPKLLKIYLGQPSHEEVFLLKRYYLGIWSFNDSDKQKETHKSAS